MKEHSGGAPEVGYIPVSDWEDESFAVPIEHFDFAKLDKPEDYLIQIVLESFRGAFKGDLPTRVRGILQSIVKRDCEAVVAAKLASFISIILEAKQPRMLAHQIVWATGMTTMDGEPITKLAKRYGVSKQAFEQGAMRICEKLNLKPCRHMRDEQARRNMSRRNYRK